MLYSITKCPVDSGCPVDAQGSAVALDAQCSAVGLDAQGSAMELDAQGSAVQRLGSCILPQLLVLTLYLVVVIGQSNDRYNLVAS